jgi:hypothetical protein
MEQIPSREANSHSASQEMPRLFMGPEGSLPCSQELTISPYPEPVESSYLPTLFLF